jgi:putative ABC transport system substrate-binding protein
MHRRSFLTLLGGSAAAWPLRADAQQQTRPVVGYFNPGSARGMPHLIEGFRRGLAEADFVEGRNVAIEYRWANGGYDKLPALAADLVRRRAAVVVPVGTTPEAIQAVQAANPMIPIVNIFGTGSDQSKTA